MSSMGSWARVCVVITGTFVLLTPTPAFAYFGPGAGLSALGSVIGVGVAILAAILGFLWYPIKRLRARFKKPKQPLDPSDS
jgi:hypothetical protein